MLAVVATALVFFLVVEPLLVALHELGHATVPLARGHETTAFVGGEVGWCVEVGSLAIVAAPRGFLAPVTYGATATERDATRATRILGALGGPVVSLALLVAIGLLLADGLRQPFLWIALLAFVYCWFQTVFTLLPMRYPGWAGGYGDYRSDGMIVLDLLRGRDAAEDGESV